MTLQEWAVRWGIPSQAFAELATLTMPEPAEPGAGKTEAFVQSKIRLEAPMRGVYLWRNNVGAGVIAHARELCPDCASNARRPIRWGLGNDSAKMNTVMKSADLIGGRSMLITPHHVGRRVLQFVSRETKSEDWQYAGTLEENAQLAWATLINSLGGDAAIVKSVGSL